MTEQLYPDASEARPRKAISQWRGDPKNPLYQAQVRNIFEREYLPHFSALESHILKFILNQTISAARPSWAFTYEKLSTGDTKTNGTGYSKRHINRAVRGLERRGVIYVALTGRGIAITPRLDWSPESEKPLVVERRRERARKGAATRQKTAMPSSTLYPQPARVDNLVTSELTSLSPLGPGRDDMLVKSELTTLSPLRSEAPNQKHEEKIRSIPTTADTSSVTGGEDESSSPAPLRMRTRPAVPAALSNPPVAPPPLPTGPIERTLCDAFALDYPDAPPTAWPDEQRARVAWLLAHNWHRTENGYGKVCDFADWLVATWSSIAENYKAPVYPDADFVLSHYVWLLWEYEGHRRGIYRHEPPRRE